MLKRIINVLPVLLLTTLSFLSTATFTPANAAELYQYTAFPPFLPRVVSPNILFVLDYSRSMVRPAYGDCSDKYQNCRYKFFNPNDDFDPNASYSGYFDTGPAGLDDVKYSCTPGTGGGAVCVKNPAGEFSSKWLNWLAATQFDILKKVAVGGDVTASPEQGNPTKLQSLLNNETIPNTAPVNQKDHTAPVQSVPTYREFYKVVEKQVCLDNAPDGLCDTTTPQRVPYNWIDPLDPAASGVDFLWGRTVQSDDQPMNRALPFTFKYFGNDFSRINISENGYIQFTNVDESVIGDWSNDNIPNAAWPNNLVAPFWDDLLISNDASSFVSLHTVGSAPNRVCVITYSNILPYFVNDINNRGVSFQILLFEGDSQIVFQYKDVDGGSGNYSDNNTDKGRSATVGLEGPTGALGKKFYYGQWVDNNFNGVVDAGDTIPTGLLENSLALHMTYGYKIFRVAPGSTYTDFRVAGAADAAAYPVNIDVTNIAKVGGVCPDGYYINKYRDACYNHVTEGLLQEFRDGELAGLLGFRLGIMYFNDADGGKVVKHFNEKDTTGWAALMTSTRSQKPTPEAPMAEALHMAQGYFRQVTADYNLGLNVASSWSNNGTGVACASTGSNYDPFCFQSAAQKVPCAKSYALLVSSGNYSHDFGRNIYLDPIIADKTPYSGAVKTTPGETAGSNEGTPANGGWLDDVAYKMHLTDLRSDNELADGAQTVGLYAVNTFGAGSGAGTAVLKRAALYGGFKDANGNGQYDSGEDDPDNPRNYFEASGGGDLRAKIISAVTEILKNSASGTSVSVLSTSAGGEGALYQAYFYPARVENLQEDRKWPGFLRAFLLDNYAQLRDDYSGGTPDHTLNTANDRVAMMSLDPSSSEVKVNLYNESGKVAEPPPDPPTAGTVSMDDVISMWEGGKQLAKSNKADRHIYLWHDANNDGVIANKDFSSIGGEAMELLDSNATALRPYLRADDDAEAAKIINYARGAEISGYRSRCITVPGAATESGCLSSGQRVWPLGDIIFSTPALVGAPAEQYHLIYSEKSYFDFYRTYKNRRQVVYLGANDGMLHAFNAGSFNPATISFADNPTTGSGWTSPLPGLGDELWSFIPHENLPHLAWLACNGTAADPATCGDAEYTHVYYADHRPRITDARIFNGPGADTELFGGGIDGQAGVVHPNGWGSILILPLRLGGGAIEVDLNGDGDVLDAGEKSFKSAYYAFDITDAEKPPKLLWRFTDPDLGFTTSYPAIVRVDDNGQKDDGNVKWFMVAGSGPQNDPPTGGTTIRDYNMLSPATTTQKGYVFVVDLVTGEKKHKELLVDGRAIMGDPIAVDVNLDFTTDVLYIGAAINANSGKVFRIATKQLLDPTTTGWEYTTLFDGVGMGPLFVSPSISTDPFGHLWVYFGSGRLKNIADLTNATQQSFYGIKDACWKGKAAADCVADGRVMGNNFAYNAAADLFDATKIKIGTPGADDEVDQTLSDDKTACGSDGKCSFQIMLKNVRRDKKGWNIKLDAPGSTPSERVLARSSVIGGLLLFTAYQPSGDICSIFGYSSLYALYYETGTSSGKIDLGAGMPTSVGITITDDPPPPFDPPFPPPDPPPGPKITGFVQKSTGEIKRIDVPTPFQPRSSITGWRETTGNTGNAGVETIYEHIVR